MRIFALTDQPAFSTTDLTYFPEHVIHHGLIYSLDGTFSFKLKLMENLTACDVGGKICHARA